MGQNVSIIGSTGSIGQSTLEVIRHNKDRFRVCALACNGNIELMSKQIAEFHPDFVSVYSEESADLLAAELKKNKLSCRILTGESGNIEAASYKKNDIAVISVVGGIGFMPTLAAIESKKKVCLANKETLVCGGSVVMAHAKKYGVRIIPIDSEHSAIWQLLENTDRKNLKRIIITASGGPFRTYDRSKLHEVTIDQALKHPNWNMGAKITIDSATLMNKGLEVIEAMWLFDLPLEKIDVIIHPQSVIHSMIELNDGSILAQLGNADMKLPINYALSYPERLDIDYVKRFDFMSMNKLTFEKPDIEAFPALKYAYDAAKTGGTMPAVMNAANEIAVSHFLKNKIKFTDISEIVLKVMKKHSEELTVSPDINDIIKCDIKARQTAEKLCLAKFGII